MVVSKDEFEAIASFILRRDLSKCSRSVCNRRFRSIFGCSSKICSILWEFLAMHGSITTKKGSSPKHLLWALLFLKLYSTESTHAAMVGGIDEKTYRKWVWLVLEDVKKIKKLVVSLIASKFM